jgi:hypothetical protein
LDELVDGATQESVAARHGVDAPGSAGRTVSLLWGRSDRRVGGGASSSAAPTNRPSP